MILNVDIGVKEELDVDIGVDTAVDIAEDRHVLGTSAQTHQQLFGFDFVPKVKHVLLRVTVNKGFSSWSTLQTPFSKEYISFINSSCLGSITNFFYKFFI